MVDTGPTDPGKRIEAVDMVRGFALFGVLLVNMYNFGATSAIWTAPVDQIAFSVMRFFFETKSWRLFSFLFGLGFAIQLFRAQARGGPFWPIYLRRLVLLFVIGMGHALFYSGDVLMAYAILGLLLAPFHRLPPRVLLGLAVVLLAVFPLGGAVKSLVLEDDPPVTSATSELAEAHDRNEELRRTHPYAVGSLREVMAENAKEIPPDLLAYPLDAEGTPAYFAMFLLGLYAGKRRLFHDVEANLPTIRTMAAWGLGLGAISMAIERGLALAWGYDVWGERGANVPMELIGDLLFAFGGTALSAGYAAGVVLLSRSSRFRTLVRPLGPVGRLALSVYLTQSLAFTTLFYGYGLGGAFRLGPAAVTAFAIVIFTTQVVVCAWWVKRYRFGPLEWLWRGLTYGRFPALRLPGTKAQ